MAIDSSAIMAVLLRADGREARCLIARARGPAGLRREDTSPTMPAPPRDMAKAAVGSLDDLLSALDEVLKRHGLAPAPVGEGVSYKLGRRSLCRIDPKRTNGYLRVQVGAELEEEAPAVLRGTYGQRGWLVVRPEDRAVALSFIEACVVKRLRQL